MEALGNQERKPPEVVVVAPTSRPAEAPFADPATGTPIQGKPSAQLGQGKAQEPGTGTTRLLDPADIEDTFERQESRLPDVCEDPEQRVGTSK